MIKKIPEKIIKICDRCEQVIDNKNGSMSGKIAAVSDGLDFQGSPVGPGDRIQWDLCDICYDATKKAIALCFSKGKKNAG